MAEQTATEAVKADKPDKAHVYSVDLETGVLTARNVRTKPYIGRSGNKWVLGAEHLNIWVFRTEPIPGFDKLPKTVKTELRKAWLIGIRQLVIDGQRLYRPAGTKAFTAERIELGVDEIAAKKRTPATPEQATERSFNKMSPEAQVVWLEAQTKRVRAELAAKTS